MAQYNPKHFLVILIFSFIFLNTINSQTRVAKANDDLIRKTCKTTKYTDLCISSLKSDPTSSKSDLKGLATIMVNVGILNATDTYSYLSTQLQNTTSDATMRKVLELCTLKYSYANDSLKSSMDDLLVENYDYASMHVTAAADYPNGCRIAFKWYRSLAYPAQLKARENGLKRICGVVLGIFDQLFIVFGAHS
ncbi:hypothetical protein RND81_06G099100 [Saponaria officinalis]|uniref:Pectinesterase inhibitor domain-containing protein n=1 Tax=Saponaria officinalis TaxID=3572 RepID=A0AAW1K868_SAPOF